MRASPFTPAIPKKLTQRLCGISDLDRRMLYIDSFYQDSRNLDVPVYFAIVEYNDKVCGENNAQPGLDDARKAGKCLHEWFELAIKDDTEAAKSSSPAAQVS